MNTLEKIEKKREQFTKVRQKHLKELKELKWQYLKEEYNLEKNCLYRINYGLYVLDDIRSSDSKIMFLSFLKVLKTGKAGKIKQYYKLTEVGKINKQYNSLEEYNEFLQQELLNDIQQTL